jgi:hypothetical protein
MVSMPKTDEDDARKTLAASVADVARAAEQATAAARRAAPA